MTEPYRFNPIHSVRWRLKYARQLMREQMERERAWLFYQGLIKPGDLVFDVGANVGNRSRMFHALGANVIALEPVWATFKQLDHNTWRYDNICPLNFGVSDHIGPSRIKLNPISTICSMDEDWIDKAERVQPKHHWDGYEDIWVTTLDALIGFHGTPRFIKIDVEGHEVSVLRGLSKPVQSLSFEYTPWRMDPAFECLDLIDALGRYRYNLAEGETFDPVFKKPVSRRIIEDVLDVQRTAKCAGDVYAVRCDA